MWPMKKENTWWQERETSHLLILQLNERRHWYRRPNEWFPFNQSKNHMLIVSDTIFCIHNGGTTSFFQCQPWVVWKGYKAVWKLPKECLWQNMSTPSNVKSQQLATTQTKSLVPKSRDNNDSNDNVQHYFSLNLHHQWTNMDKSDFYRYWCWMLGNVYRISSNKRRPLLSAAL